MKTLFHDGIGPPLQTVTAPLQGKQNLGQMVGWVVVTLFYCQKVVMCVSICDYVPLRGHLPPFTHELLWV